MKTLHYRRHSTKDGTVIKDTIGLKGLELARQEGWNNDTKMNMIFHGPLIRTAQTALAFIEGYYCDNDLTDGETTIVMPVVLEIGTDEVFQSIATDSFKAAIKTGQSNFQAVLVTYQADQIKPLAVHAMKGVTAMLGKMEDGETAIAFGHSPIIELAAWAICGFSDLPTEQQRLDDMEGLIFVQTDSGHFSVTGKISVATDAST